MRTLFALAFVLGALVPASAQTLRCRFGPGATPVVTAPRKPHGAQIPIDTIVVAMQENRSSEHFFAHLRFQGQPHVRRVPRNASHPDPTNPRGPPISRFHQTRYSEVADLDHAWNGTHNEWDNGAMDGFTTANQNANDLNGSRTMGYYDSSDLPFYYSLYSQFAMGDRYFCSLLSHTFPNRFYLLTGTSFAHTRNDIPTDISQSAPPARTISAQRDNPAACLPDNIPPMLQGGDVPGMFDRYGIRVPVVVISPYSRKHYVSHRIYDHTSVLRFIETRFDLGALTRRDANADPMLRFFNFRRAAFATPPTLPTAPVDPAHRMQCSPSGAFIDPVVF